jgi:hypothetical protein
MPRQLPDLLKAYEYFTSKSDSPQVFHLWIALGTIAGAAQRKIFMHTLYFDVGTNFYIFLTSPPGRAKKGAALRTGKNFLRVVEPKVNFASEAGSPEGIYDLLTKISNPAHQSMTLFSMELGTLMATRSAEMVDFLTDLYDGNPDFARHTLGNPGKNVAKPWFNLMSGTTPKWLGDKLGLIALEGGLVARSIFPYSEERILKNSWPKASKEFTDIGQAIAEDLSHIATLEGEFQFDDDGTGDYEKGLAFKFYDAWYQDNKPMWDKLPKELREVTHPHGWASRFPIMDDPRTASYYDRKHIHLLKVAMALSLSYKDDLILTVEDLQRSLVLLNQTEPGMHKALGSAGKNPLAAETMRVAAQIATKGKATYKELIIANFHDLGKLNLDRVLDDLRMMGRIRQEGMMFLWMDDAS